MSKRECTACRNQAWYCRECFNYACEQAQQEAYDKTKTEIAKFQGEIMSLPIPAPEEASIQTAKVSTLQEVYDRIEKLKSKGQNEI